MIYRKWSLMTMPFALVGGAGVVALGSALLFKDKAVSYMEQFRQEGELLRLQDREMIAREKQLMNS